MTTGPKKGLYYYTVLLFSIVGFFIMIYSFHYIKTAYVNGTFFTDILGTIYALASIMAEFVLISEVLKHKEGYTTVVTTKYNLYKCRAIGEEKTFMMFADNEEELELFFAITAQLSPWRVLCHPVTDRLDLQITDHRKHLKPSIR